MEKHYPQKDKDVLSSRYSKLEGLKILLVEDNVINIAITKKLLSRWNSIEVVVAMNGLIGVEKVKNNVFDVIIMDVDMPVMDGLTASREIRKFDCETPIIVVTSNHDAEIRNGFEDLGIHDIIYKPLDLEHLYQTIEKCAMHMVTL